MHIHAGVDDHMGTVRVRGLLLGLRLGQAALHKLLDLTLLPQRHLRSGLGLGEENMNDLG